MRASGSISFVVAVVLASSSSMLVVADSTGKGAGFMSIKASEIKWIDAPSVGPGAKIAILEGDMKTASPFTMRLKLPPNLKVGVYTHPAAERVIVLSGSVRFAIGDKYEPSRATTYRAGDGFIVPAGMPMFGLTDKDEAMIEIHGLGPWGIHYLDPVDKPRKK